LLVGAGARAGVARDLATFVDDYSLPGAVAVVCTRRGSTRAAAGFSDLRAKRKMRPTDRFWIGSVSKTFVATVVLQLVGEGAIASSGHGRTVASGCGSGRP
jgi:D-alanyl-D-alanine carboxypeptidase